MSMMDRLKSIRSRVQVQSSELPRPRAEADFATVDGDAPFGRAVDRDGHAIGTGGPRPASGAPVNMWDIVDDVEDVAEAFPAFPEPAAVETEVAPPAPRAPLPPQSTLAEADPSDPSAARRAGRVKTRLLGFDSAPAREAEAPAPAAPERSGASQFPVGWLAVIDGPGRGATFALQNGVSPIGRDEDQAVQIDFGDGAISRKNHAAIAFDTERNGFFIGHGGKSNLVRLNGQPLLSTEELKNGDTIRIGETTLRLVALCGETFSWTNPGR